jgi:hypothetical protein
MQQIGEAYKKDPVHGREFAKTCGKTMAAELVTLDIDFSFAPVLDLDLKLNNVIASRSFSSSSEVVADLGACFMIGMHEAGMAAVGKHFPGHGSVTVDSHYQIPISSLGKDDPIFEQGICPFKKLIEAGIEALMPAHIIFKAAEKGLIKAYNDIKNDRHVCERTSTMKDQRCKVSGNGVDTYYYLTHLQEDPCAQIISSTATASYWLLSSQAENKKAVLNLQETVATPNLIETTCVGKMKGIEGGVESWSIRYGT